MLRLTLPSWQTPPPRALPPPAPPAPPMAWLATIRQLVRVRVASGEDPEKLLRLMMAPPLLTPPEPPGPPAPPTAWLAMNVELVTVVWESRKDRIAPPS